MLNLYIRYFDYEVLASSYEQAFDFLYSIEEIEMNTKIENDIREYMESAVQFPKRYKVRPRIYFIMIKTTAKTMEEFKLNNKNNQPQESVITNTTHTSAKAQQNMIYQQLFNQKPGWYEGILDFKRVIVNPSTGKCIYRDTHFVVRCKALSPADCYDRIIEHLLTRVDNRSQFPSIKGKNFQYKFLGEQKPA